MVERPLGPLDGPAYEVIDPRFAPLTAPGARIERLWTGARWVEGPAWLSGEGLLVWSDIPGDRMLSWHEESGTVATFRQPAGSPNGNTIDREGRLVTCEQTLHRIVRREKDGSLTSLVDRIAGRRFNSPNDVIVASDGCIWFTDPHYGRDRVRAPGLDVDGCHVYRFDPATGAIDETIRDFVMPNGLALAVDETSLYVVDTGSTEMPDGPNHLRRFSIEVDGTLSGGEVLIAEKGGHFDGFRVDAEGRLWMGADDGVRCYLPDGTLIGRIALPERASNLTFGGASGNRLLMTATTSVYSCVVNAVGAVVR